jgi:hypothetical protein
MVTRGCKVQGDEEGTPVILLVVLKWGVVSRYKENASVPCTPALHTPSLSLGSCMLVVGVVGVVDVRLAFRAREGCNRTYPSSQSPCHADSCSCGFHLVLVVVSL